ncbi:Retrovirus-related Pol polyprotein from transposon TNT 1-94 [Nymphaea thermarum]|nr:Retrovirus-related Pol polyprotein from transposon TNT 1-94 [Nymphaea thermarum]
MNSENSIVTMSKAEYDQLMAQRSLPTTMSTAVSSVMVGSSLSVASTSSHEPGIVDQLGVAGYVVSDKEKVQQTLSGLEPDFYAFTTALEVLPILPTFNELQGKLLQHEMNMKQLMRGTNQGNAHNVLVMEAVAGHRKGNRTHQGGMNHGHDEQTGKAPSKYIIREVSKTVVGDEIAGASAGSEVRIQFETLTENNPEYELWLAHDQSLVAYITSTLSEEVLGSIDDDLTALELWTTLATTYSQVSEARFFQLRRQFQDIKRGTRTVLEYLNEIKNVSDQLAAIGHPVSDKDKVQQALSGLGTEFDIFCTALEVLPVLPSFEDLKAKLFQHEASRVQRQNLVSSNSHNVLITGTHALQGNRTRSWAPQTGMGRGILPTPPGMNATSGTYRRVPTCFYCNKKGHVKSECWHNPQNKSNQNRRDNRAAAGSPSSSSSQGAEMLTERTLQDVDEPETVVSTSLDSMPSTSQPSDPPMHNRFSGQVYSRRSVPTAVPRKSQRVRHPIDRWELVNLCLKLIKLL